MLLSSLAEEGGRLDTLRLDGASHDRTRPFCHEPKQEDGHDANESAHLRVESGRWHTEPEAEPEAGQLWRYHSLLCLDE